MLSKWSLWDFFKAYPTISPSGQKGLHGFSFFDPIISNMATTDLSLKKVSGENISIDWISDNLQGLSLFGEDEEYLFMNADLFSVGVQKYFLAESDKLKDRHLVFHFSKENKFFDEMAALDHVNFCKIDPPKFWEGGKLLNFLVDKLKLRLSYPVQNYLLSAVPNTLIDLHQTLNLIDLYSEEGLELDLEKVKEIISPYKFDQFHLASMFSKKRQSDFYKELLSFEIDYDQLRGLFFFMQGHLFKLLDPSYIEKKKRASKYDNEIKSLASLWTREELKKEMHTFAELEVLAKRSDLFLKDALRLRYTQSF